jgi:hypothetical protein
MKENIENIERYLKGVALPEHESHQHRQQLRHKVLEQIERRQTMSVGKRTWKVAAVIAVVAGVGAIATAVGIKVYRYHFEGRGRDGEYHFSTEPEVIYKRTYLDPNGAERTYTVTHGGWVSVGAANATNAEQAGQDLEEIALLRQQDARELVGVIETEVNGHLHRTFRYRYVLSDGRIRTIGESEPGKNEPLSPEQIDEDRKQIDILREKGEGELTKVIDTEVEGELHRTCIYKYILADGREKSVGGTDPELAQPATELSTEQIHEIWRLRQLEKGEFLGHEDKQVQGQTFTFDTYMFTLADGTVVIHGVGEPKGLKTSLTQTDWEELHELMEARVGEDLGVVEKEFNGRLFVFKRQRFILSDGTEVIWSNGRLPEDSQNEVTKVVSDPKKAAQVLNDRREIASLRKQDKRNLIAVDELTANGELDRRVFVYQYQLSDGRTMDLREGDELNTVRNKKLRGDELNFALNKNQRQEWVQLKDAGSGEDLGTYEQEVMGSLFVFKRQKFTLSDGTELIWSYGTLKDDQ